MNEDGTGLPFAAADNVEVAIGIDVAQDRIFGAGNLSDFRSGPWLVHPGWWRPQVDPNNSALFPSRGDIETAVVIEIGQSHAVGTA